MIAGADQAVYVLRGVGRAKVRAVGEGSGCPHSPDVGSESASSRIPASAAANPQGIVQRRRRVAGSGSGGEFLRAVMRVPAGDAASPRRAVQRRRRVLIMGAPASDAASPRRAVRRRRRAPVVGSPASDAASPRRAVRCRRQVFLKFSGDRAGVTTPECGYAQLLGTRQRRMSSGDIVQRGCADDGRSIVCPVEDTKRRVRNGVGSQGLCNIRDEIGVRRGVREGARA